MAAYAGNFFTGELAPWGQVERLADWDALLLGNGMSINVWDGFDYPSLFSRARLAPSDRRTFGVFGTKNFEAILKRLDDAIILNDINGLDSGSLRAQRASIADALGKTVVAVHPPRRLIEDHQLEAIYMALRQYRWVFSTSYDLVAYYAMASQKFKDVVDYFWGPDGSFDETSIWLSDRWSGTRFIYLHGAVHLVSLTNGRACKRAASLVPLLDKFDRPHAGDSLARPLIVTEGASHQKLKEIQQSSYLSFGLRTLTERAEPLVIFGHSLGDQDRHLLSAINERPERPIAVGLVDEGKTSNRQRMAEVHSRLPDLEIHFFDAISHPLGAPNLKVASARRTVASIAA